MIYEYIVKISDEVIEDFFAPDLPPRLIRCKDCAFATNSYLLINAVICNNKNSPCNTHVVDDDFYCKAGKAKDGEQDGI